MDFRSCSPGGLEGRVVAEDTRRPEVRGEILDPCGERCFWLGEQGVSRLLGAVGLQVVKQGWAGLGQTGTESILGGL